jgi:hypothetical protein
MSMTTSHLEVPTAFVPTRYGAPRYGPPRGDKRRYVEERPGTKRK